MADITMCTNLNCPVREKCYRATAKKDYYQWVGDFEYKIVDGMLHCEGFWCNKEENCIDYKRENGIKI